MNNVPVPPDVDPADPAYVENPVTGERFLFHARPTDPETDPLAFDLWAPPEMTPLATHVHRRQTEEFAVRAGTLALERAGETETVTAGADVTIPPGTAHTWRPAGDGSLHLAVRFRPGLRTEAFLRDLAALARRGAVRSDGAPSLLWVAAIYDAYGYDVMHLASPPLSVQRALFGVLAPLARLRGYEANPVGGRDD